LIGVSALIEPRPAGHPYGTVTTAPAPGIAMSPSPTVESPRTPETATMPSRTFDTDVTRSDAPGRAPSNVRTAGAVVERVLADWHVSPKADLETGRFVTWPKDSRGTVRVEIAGLAAEDLARLHFSLYVDNPNEKFGMIFGNMRPGVTVASAERWAGVRVRIAPFLYEGGEAALWKKYPAGLHIRVIATEG
jgi:hypothetical protein